MSILSSSRPCPSVDEHERIFIDRLDKVMHWARQIASGDASLAEDLAQDAFLHFSIGRPSLNEISNIDKYLYVVLKNLFRSHLASVSRRCAVAFDPLAHESAMQTWRSVDAERRLTLREELCRICAFICERKETSKGASAFLLHFFHNFSLRQVSVVMQTSRAAVDERLSVIRKEARLDLERRKPLLVKAGAGELAMMTELQSIIASSCRGRCLSIEEAQRYYTPGGAEIPRGLLAHMASCGKCLSTVVQILQFPKDFGDPPAPSGDRNRISCWKRKREELLSTEPSELRLMINGHLLARERVHGPDNDFSVSIALREPLDFVEIWSHETTRLLLLPGISEPPEGKYAQEANVDLRTGSLQLTLQFADPWPTVAVRYAARTREHVAGANQRGQNQFLGVPLPRQLAPRRWLPFNLSIPTFSGGLALALAAILFFVQTKETALSAAELLVRAEKWEKEAATAQTPVVHRRFSLTKRQQGRPPQRTFVEVWRGGAVEFKLNRWTDAAGHLLGEARVASYRSIHLQPENVWQFEPSADAFMAAAGAVDYATVSRTAEQTTIRASVGELVLDRATNRPMEERFSFDTGDYVFSEAWTETVPLAESPLLLSVPKARPAGERLRALNQSRRVETPSPNPYILAEERELRVRQEIHALGLATATSIGRHDNRIDVELAPTSIEQERILLAALDKIAGVKVSVLSTKAAVDRAVRAAGSAPTTSAGEKLKEPDASKWLNATLGSASKINAEKERRLEKARYLVNLAGEWRLLADRYPERVESHLPSQARAILREIAGDLRTQIQQEVLNERIAILDLLRDGSENSTSPIAQRPCETWQVQAVRTADLAWENERVIELFYGPSTGAGTTTGEGGLSKLRSLADMLAVSLETSCEARGAASQSSNTR